MKKQIITALIALGATISANAQPQNGTVTFDNFDANLLASPTATNFGLIFICDGNSIFPLNQDINLVLLGGPSASSLSLIAALTFATGTAQTDWSFFKVPGLFFDPKGLVYTVPGVALNGTAFFEVEAWLGADATYEEARNDAATGNSGIYKGLTGGGGSPPHNPVDIGDGMPSFIVSPAYCPEPTTLAFGGLGVAALLLLRRKK